VIVRALLLVGALLMLAPEVAAQQVPKTYRVGILGVGDQVRIRDALRDVGYVEGRNVVYETRDTGGDPGREDPYAKELVRAGVDVIIATYPSAVFAAKRSTSTIPIVMVNTPDPVQLGIVGSLASPGGNITGTTSLSVDLTVKQLEILREAVPTATRFAMLWNPDNPWHPLVVRELSNAKRIAGLDVRLLPLRRPADIDVAFDTIDRERIDAVVVPADPMLHTPANRARITQLLLARRLPSIGGLRGFAEIGGMMSYWPDASDHYQRVASYVDRILKGASPGRLPIEQPTKYELVINAKTTAALGRTIPQALLLRATVVE
jgi:ABC-type uncharacterized transport system substrate-binding protein